MLRGSSGAGATESRWRRHVERWIAIAGLGVVVGLGGRGEAACIVLGAIDVAGAPHAHPGPLAAGRIALADTYGPAPAPVAVADRNAPAAGRPAIDAFVWPCMPATAMQCGIMTPARKLRRGYLSYQPYTI